MRAKQNVRSNGRGPAAGATAASFDVLALKSTFVVPALGSRPKHIAFALRVFIPQGTSSYHLSAFADSVRVKRT